MAIDPANQPQYLTQSPPLVPERALGMIISMMGRRYRFCAYEPFSNGALECGVFVTSTYDAVLGKTKVAKPTAAGANILGVSILNFQRVMTYDGTLDAYILPNDSLVSLLEMGDIVMYAESPVNVGDPVFMRYAADTGKPRIGALANAAGAGLEARPGAQFLEVKTSPGLVRVDLKF